MRVFFCSKKNKGKGLRSFTHQRFSKRRGEAGVVLELSADREVDMTTMSTKGSPRRIRESLVLRLLGGLDQQLISLKKLATSWFRER